MAIDEIGNTVYVLAEETPDGEHRSVIRAADGGVMWFRERLVPEMLVGAFARIGRPCVVLTFDLRHENPCVI